VPTTTTTDPGGHGLAVVTFRLPAASGATSACVVAEFNDWSHTAMPMRATGDGFEATTVLAYGRQYRFRYLIDGHRWENDWAADAYVPNEYGGDDSVLDLTVKPSDSSSASGVPEADAARRDGDAARKGPRPVRIWQ
jgi:1,4-alpha-glucan branching enzyme